MIEEKGERLRLLITHLGLTQTAFAKKVGIRANYLTSIVNGHKELSGGILEAISNMYGEVFNMGWLISGKGSMLISPSEIKSDKVNNAKEISLEQLAKDMREIELRVTRLEIHTEYKSN